MNTQEYTIVFKNDIREDSILIKEMSSSRKIDDSLEHLCTETWQKTVEEASLKGQKLWDSEVYRFQGVSEENGKTVLTVGTIPFSIRFAMNKHTALVRQLGEAYYPLGMYTSCLVKTKDDKYIFIEKSNKFYTDKKYAFVGGILSKSERIISSGADLFASAKIEIVEELGLSQSHIADTVLSAGYKTENCNFCLLFNITITCTFDEVQEYFAQETDGEAKNIIGITQSELPVFAKNLEDKDKIRLKVLDFLLD